MLSDRDYMRDGSGRMPLSLTTWLILVMAVSFGLQCIDGAYVHLGFEEWLKLSVQGLRHGYVWQLLTYQFLHEGIMHLLSNLLALWWCGTYCERMMGPRRTLLALLGCGIVGALLQCGLMSFGPNFFGKEVVGASAGIAGLLAIFCLKERESVIQIWGIFPIRAIHFFYILGGISLFFTLVPTGDAVAHPAHLGGLLAGALWVRLGWFHDYQPLPGEIWVSRFMAWWRHRTRRPLILEAPWRSLPPEPTQARSSGAPDEFITREVDPILEKIAAHGIQSLTPEERDVLQLARRRMDRR